MDTLKAHLNTLLQHNLPSHTSPAYKTARDLRGLIIKFPEKAHFSLLRHVAIIMFFLYLSRSDWKSVLLFVCLL